MSGGAASSEELRKSKNAACLKLWFLIKAYGKDGLAKLIEQRHNMANEFYNYLQNRDDFIVLNKVGINAVMFLYAPQKLNGNLDAINQLNKEIFDTMLIEGEYYLHNFPIKINGKFKYDKPFYPLRFMSGNNNLTKQDLLDVVQYVKETGDKILNEK